MSDTESNLTPRAEQQQQTRNEQPKSAKLSPFVAHRAKRHRPPGSLTDNDEFMAAAIGDTAWLKQTLKSGKNPSQYDKNVSLLSCCLNRFSKFPVEFTATYTRKAK